MIKILEMVVIQLRRDWSTVRPGSMSHYTSYKTPVKTRSRRHSATSRPETEDFNRDFCDTDVEMKLIKYETQRGGEASDRFAFCLLQIQKLKAALFVSYPRKEKY